MALPATDSSGVARGATPAEVHRGIVERYADVLAGRLDEALALVDPDVIDHRGGTEGDHHGLAAWRRRWELLGEAGVHDVSTTIEQNVSAGDVSVNRYTIRGTHTASGQKYEVVGLDMVVVRDGRLVEHWALVDQAAMAHQISSGT